MIILFCICLLICIFLHELSHLIVAKKCNCGVEVFSVGFGKPIYSFEYKETRYNFTPWLLGGYCKLAGELELSDKSTDFSNLPYHKKFYITIAGCVMNILSGLVGLGLGYLLFNRNLAYFGVLSITLGVGNLLPIPALDGFYIIGLPLCLKVWGKERGYEIFALINKIGFIIIIAINILCIPWLIHLIKNGGM